MDQNSLTADYKMSEAYEWLVLEILQTAVKKSQDTPGKGGSVFFKQKRIG